MSTVRPEAQVGIRKVSLEELKGAQRLEQSVLGQGSRGGQGPSHGEHPKPFIYRVMLYLKQQGPTEGL